jgi:CBS domain containing-hemolysin-like protein
VLAALFSIVSTSILNGLSWGIGMFVVLVIVWIGIFFDMVGIAATAADEIPFHSMASNKVHGAKHSIQIIRNADRFASFCNDVIGDISGIISGAAAAIVIAELTLSFKMGVSSVLEYSISIIMTSVIAAMTVGGKAFGKSIAIRYSRDIIFQVGKLLYFLEKHTKIKLFKDKKRKKKKRK